MKKKIVINIALTLLITIISIFGEVFLNTYPYDFTISKVVNYYYAYSNNIILWTILLMAGGVFIIASVFEYFFRKFNIRILKHIGTILLSVIIIFSSVLYFVGYLQIKHNYEERLVFYVNQAKEGIENDKIKIDYLGGDLGPWIKEGKRNTVDSIMSNYGVEISRYNSFLYSRINEKAIEKYLEIVNAYLDERNGEGWRQRMDAELGPYIDRLVVEH